MLLEWLNILLPVWLLKLNFLSYLFSKMHIKLLIKTLEPNTDFLTSKIAFDYISTVYTSLSDSCLVYRFNFYQDK